MFFFAVANTFNWLNQSRSHRHECPSALSGTTCRVRHHTDYGKIQNHNSYDPPHKVHKYRAHNGSKRAHIAHCPHVQDLCDIYETFVLRFVVFFLYFCCFRALQGPNASAKAIVATEGSSMASDTVQTKMCQGQRPTAALGM